AGAATPALYPLSLHDALPIYPERPQHAIERARHRLQCRPAPAGVAGDVDQYHLAVEAGEVSAMEAAHHLGFVGFVAVSHQAAERVPLGPGARRGRRQRAEADERRALQLS